MDEIITTGKNTSDLIRLNPVEVAVYGTVKRAIFNPGAVPDVIPTDLCTQLHVQPSKTYRRMKTADCKEKGVVGELTFVQVTVGESKEQSTFLIVEQSAI